MQRIVSIAICALLVLGLAGCSGISQEGADKIAAEITGLEKERDQLRSELAAAQKRIEEFQELEALYQELSHSELEAAKAANVLQAEQDRLQLEKLLAEQRAEEEAKAALAAAAREAEERKGYETGITYNQLARTPDDYEWKKVKFTGRVLQVLEGDEVNLRIAVNGNSDTVILVYYRPSITEVRVLERDNITIYGVFQGLHTYKSVMGASITIPLIRVDKLEIN